MEEKNLDIELKEKNKNTSESPDSTSEKMYTEKELFSLIEKARSEEKSKLNDKIIELKKDLKELKAVKEDSTLSLSEKEKTISELKEEIEKLKMEGENKMSEKEKELEEKLQEAQNALVKLQQEKETLELTHKLDKFKSAKIEEVKLPKEVQSLVSGSSEKEITESIEKAKALYEEITKSVIEEKAKEHPAPPSDKSKEDNKMNETNPFANAFFAPGRVASPSLESGLNTKVDLNNFSLATEEGKAYARSIGLL